MLKRTAESGFIALGVVLVGLCADLFLKSNQCIGTIVRPGYMTFSTSSGPYSSGVGSGAASQIQFTVAGRDWTVEGTDGDIGELVEVWYYSRWPKIAWLGGRSTGLLVAALFVAIYWVLLVLARTRQLGRLVGRPIRPTRRTLRNRVR